MKNFIKITINTFAAVLFGVLSFGGIAQADYSATTTLLKSGTFTVPTGVTSLTVTAIGAGAGGGGGAFTYGGGGGSAGEYISGTIVSVTPGQTISYTVGAGGIGGTAGSYTSMAGNGSNGGSTIFGSVTARGGIGGQGAAYLLGNGIGSQGWNTTSTLDDGTDGASMYGPDRTFGGNGGSTPISVGGAGSIGDSSSYIAPRAGIRGSGGGAGSGWLNNGGNIGDAGARGGDGMIIVSYTADLTAPVITVLPYSTSTTNLDVAVTAVTNEGNIISTSTNASVVNAGATTTATFSENGSVTFIATDAAGNVSSTTITITNIDKVAPIITVLPYATSSTNSNVAVIAVTDEGMIDATSTTPASIASISNAGATSTVIFSDNGTVTFTAIDAAGNFSSRTITISNIDLVAPIITVLPYATSSTNSDITVIAITNEGTIIGTSTIAIVTNEISTSAAVFTDNGTVTFTATDEAGNYSSRTITISNIDRIAPVITINGANPMDVEINSVYTDAGATAFDAIDGVLTVSATGTVDTSATGTYTIVYSASDLAGNIATSTRTVNVVDTMAPVITVPGTQVFEATGTTTNPVLVLATAIDNSSSSPVITYNPASFGLGTTTVVWTATDLSGNVATATSLVVITDTTAPVMSLIGPATVVLNVGDTYIELGATATDIVDGPVAVTATGTVDTSIAGTYTIVYSASDLSGNTSTTSREVIVSTVVIPDTTAPVIILNGSSTINLLVGDTYVELGATAFDLMDGPVAVTATGTVDTNATGTYEIIYSATDAALNTATTSRIVIVSIAPVVLTSISISPLNLVIAPSATTTFVSTTLDQFGNPFATTTDWTSSDALVGTIDNTGVFMGIAPGTTTITATAGTISTSTVVTVQYADFSVILASTTPASSNVSVSQLNVNFSEYTFTNTGILPADISELDFVNNGTAATTSFANVTLYQGTTSIAVGNNIFGSTFRFGSSPTILFTIPAGSSVTLSVRADISSSAIVGETMNLSLSSMGMYYTTIFTGTFPPTAGTMTVVGTSTPDTTAPVITILGNNPENITVGDSYTDAGATALDDVDGPVAVTATGTVDTLVVGTYEIIYTATDAAMNVATTSRIVNVNPIVIPVTNTVTIINSTVNGIFYASHATTSGAIATITGTTTITDSTVSSSTLNDSIISTSTIVSSNLNRCTILYSTVGFFTGTDCFIDPSDVWNSTGDILRVIDSTIYDSDFSNSDIEYSTVLNSTVNYSTSTYSYIATSTVLNSEINYSTTTNSYIATSTIDNSIIDNSNISLSDIDGSTILSSIVIDSTLATSTIDNGSVINESDVSLSDISNSDITNSTLVNATSTDSIVNDSVINNSELTTSVVASSTVVDSNIVNSTSTDSTITDSSVTDSAIGNSTVASSTITDSTLTNSSTTDSTIASSTLTNVVAASSTITGTTLVNATTTDAVITDGMLISGTITINGTTTTVTPPQAPILISSIGTPALFTLTYTAGVNGTITGSSTQVVVSGTDGTAVNAVANVGYHFVDWSDASVANPRTDTAVAGDITVTANFAVDVVLPIAVTGVTVNPTTLNLLVGATANLTATVLPVDASNLNIAWNTTDASVATVANGVVTAVATGTADITVTTQDGNFVATTTVTVTDASGPIAVTGVTLDQPTMTLTVGTTGTLLASVIPANATNLNIDWSSDNTAVATVIGGVVTAVSAGTANITVTTVDGSFTAISAVTVNPTGPVNVPVTGITLDQTTLTLAAGDSATLIQTIAPSNATDQNIVWNTTDASVATVANGVVTAVATGTADITVTTVDGSFTATSTVTVSGISAGPVAVSGVSVNPTTLSLTVGQTGTLVQSIVPANATNQNITWSSDNSSVATVNSGVVTAVASGTANIIVTTVDGNFTATTTVTVADVIVPVNEPVTGVSVTPITLNLVVGNTASLVQTIIPATASNQNINWASDNSTIATVSVSGVVTAVATGTANITVTTVDGGFVATSTVTVTEPAGTSTVSVTGVTVNPTTLNLLVGNTSNLTATVLPVDASNLNIAWNTTDASVATVANGVVTAVATGTADITVTTQDGNFVATTTVTVTSIVVPTLTSIAITTPANVLVYTVGQSLNIAGLVITGTYSDGSTSTQAITIANVTGFNSAATATAQVLTVTVGAFTATYTVDINEAPVVPPTEGPTNFGGTAEIIPIIETPETNTETPATSTETNIPENNTSTSTPETEIPEVEIPEVIVPEVSGGNTEVLPETEGGITIPSGVGELDPIEDNTPAVSTSTGTTTSSATTTAKTGGLFAAVFEGFSDIPNKPIMAIIILALVAGIIFAIFKGKNKKGNTPKSNTPNNLPTGNLDNF